MGKKRKLPPAPEGGSAEPGSMLYQLQRQSMLDLSLGKFQRCETEPRLLRSVLISNTLRQIQEEIRLDSSPPTSPSRTTEPCPQEEAPPTWPPAMSRLAGSEIAGEEWMESEEDFSLSSTVSSILKDLDTVIDGGPAAHRTPLGSIENLAGKAGPRREGGTGVWRAERCAEGCRAPEGAVFGSVEVMRSSYLCDVTLDDLFLDIDTSVCERDAGTLGARALSGDELLKYLPTLASPFPLSPSPRDFNELEHIMEILVGS